jgi:hypothetical protein
MSVWTKLQVKAVAKTLIVNAPDEFGPHVAEVPGVVDVAPAGKTAYDLILVFVYSAADIRKQARLARRLNGDGLLWFAYPKKSSKKYSVDISRDGGWEPLGALGFEGVRQIAIDDDWSALRFRQAGRIKSLTRSAKLALSAEGKKRVKKR